MFGDDARGRSPSDIAFVVALFVAKKGTLVNYYMVCYVVLSMLFSSSNDLNSIISAITTIFMVTQFRNSMISAIKSTNSS